MRTEFIFPMGDNKIEEMENRIWSHTDLLKILATSQANILKSVGLSFFICQMGQVNTALTR
jgi:hypothetical protein